jgi:hypothetical protein
MKADFCIAGIPETAGPLLRLLFSWLGLHVPGEMVQPTARWGRACGRAPAALLLVLISSVALGDPVVPCLGDVPDRGVPPVHLQQHATCHGQKMCNVRRKSAGNLSANSDGKPAGSAVSISVFRRTEQT